MSLHLLATTPLRVITNTYNSAGVGQAVLPFASTELLAASNTNVNYFDIRATALTVDGSLEIVLAGDAMTDDADCDVTITRPLGGSDMATIANLRALQIHLTADEVSTAELDSGVTASRVAGLTYSLQNAAGSAVYAQGILFVSAAEEVASYSAIIPETHGADMKLVIALDVLPLKTRLQILTAAE